MLKICAIRYPFRITYLDLVDRWFLVARSFDLFQMTDATEEQGHRSQYVIVGRSCEKSGRTSWKRQQS